MNGRSPVHKGQLHQQRRRRHRRRPNKKRRRRQYARFRANTFQRHLKVAEQESEWRQQQKLHSQRIGQREEELLSRTIFVTHVIDLKRGRNLARLQQYFNSNYGDVEWCKLASYSGRSRAQQRSYYPRARVRFRDKSDAEKVFGGKSLLEARSQNESAHLTCDVGHLGYVVVLPSNPYSDMIQDLQNAPVTIETCGMALGHWVIGDEDEYVATFADPSMDEEGGKSMPEVPGTITTITTTGDDWLEEVLTPFAPSVTIDLQARSVRFSFQRTSGLGKNSDDLLSLKSMVNALEGLDLSDTYKYELSFRFKDISGAMEVYKENQAFSLYFRLKHPPRLYKKIDSLLGDDKPERCTQMLGLSRETLGSCRSYKLQISSIEAEKLLSNFNVMEKLRRFGILRDKTRHGTTPPRKTALPTNEIHKRLLERKLAHVHDADAKLGECIPVDSNS